MKIVSTIEEVRAQVKEWKKEGLSIGFVPTMGYLHEGHMSLIDAAGENDKVVVSIFVNPMQFGVGEDLESYPRDMERDSALCENAGAALIFHPQPEEMYHKDFSSFVDMNTLTKGLCGKTRPIHFRGVCTVVSKLFNIVQPDKGYAYIAGEVVWCQPSGAFSRSADRRIEVVSYYTCGSCLLWTEGCTAACRYPPHGIGFEFRH